MAFLSTIGIALAGLCLWVYIKYRLAIRFKPGTTPIPGPPPVPVLGNFLELRKFPQKISLLLLEWSKVYGEIFRFWGPGNRQMVVVSNPQMVKALLVTQFSKGKFWKGKFVRDNYRVLFGNGIFNVNGEEWKRHRKFASFLFQREKLKQHLAVFTKHARRLLVKLESLPQGSDVDMQDYFMRYTLDSFGEVGFGCELNSIDQEGNQFARAFDEAQSRLQYRTRFGAFSKYMPTDKVLERHLKWLDQYTYAIIRQRQQEDTEALSRRPDLLSQIIVAHRTGDKNSPAQSEEELRDFVINFMIAGRDTTAMMLTWLSYLLATNPAEQEAVVEELRTNGFDAACDWERTKGLRYSKQALQEALRLFPPVPNDGFSAKEDTMMPGGYFIQKGTTVFYSAYSLHRQPDLWPQPEEFRPARFDNPPAPFTFVPFHGGPRICLGQDMAFLEAKVMLSLLLERYELRVSPGFQPQLKFAIILTSRNGIQLNLVPRADAGQAGGM